jgi:hypothetical protein
MLWKSVPDRLQHPLGPMTNSAFADVKTLGFSVSENCLLFEKTLSLIPLRIIDVLRSLNALCTAAQTRIDKIGQPARGLAYESLKLALRLGYLGQEQNVYSNEQAIEEYFGECLRLATLLFIWAFTRKVPLTSPTMKTCHKQIRTLIASERFDELIRKTELNGAHMEVILWMLLVLGSTAHSIQDRAFYADSIRRFIPQALMYSFAEIQEKCTQIVWLFRTCDTPAGTFWTMCSFGI